MWVSENCCGVPVVKNHNSGGSTYRGPLSTESTIYIYIYIYTA